MEFVKAVQEKRIRYAIEPSKAAQCMDTSFIPPPDAKAFHFWNWIALLSGVGGLVLGFFFPLLFLGIIATPIIWSGNKKTATQIVLREAGTNPYFYNFLRDRNLLHIEEVRSV